LVPIYAARQSWTNADNLFVVHAARNFLDGVSPYVDERFLYPPSAIPFAVVLTPLSDKDLQNLVPFGCAALLLAGWWAVLRLFEVPFNSLLATAPIAVAGLFAPLINVILLGSWTAPIAALGCLAFLLMSRGRWVAAGAVVGLAIAAKPMLVPLGLIFLLGRRWKGFSLAAGVPIAICGVMLLLIPNPDRFFTETVPFLLGGQDEYSRPYDASIPTMLLRIGIDGPIVSIVRLLVAGAVIVLTVRRWRQGGHEGLRVVESSAILLIGTFLVSTPGFDHYILLVAPALLASAATVGSPVRTAWFWLAMLPQVGAVWIPELEDFHRRAYKDNFMFVVLLGGLMAHTLLRRTVPDPKPEPPAAAGPGIKLPTHRNPDELPERTYDGAPA
jgi:arabinofuranan 3-O-arabinosyltransferase